MALHKDFPLSPHIEFWPSRDFVEDHFVDVTEMIEIGKGGQQPVKTVLLSHYACRELGGTMPEDLPAVESIKKIENKQRRQLGKADKPAKKKSE
ncbi:MAG: hypothetical protein ABIK15_10080 [Pseudomonadota bacterium]